MSLQSLLIICVVIDDRRKRRRFDPKMPFAFCQTQLQLLCVVDVTTLCSGTQRLVRSGEAEAGRMLLMPVTRVHGEPPVLRETVDLVLLLPFRQRVRPRRHAV